MKDFKRNIKYILLIVFYFFIIFPTISQTFEGKIVDSINYKGIENANIAILENKKGTITNKHGNFLIENVKIPITLQISCIGYETKTYKIKSTNLNKIHIIRLSPKVFLLDDVIITGNEVNLIYKDRNFSVLDFEIKNNTLILLIYKSNLNNCKLITLDLNGDTIFALTLKNKAKGLYKDIFSNIYLISNDDKLYQILLKNDSIKFKKPLSFKLLKNDLETYQFKLNEKYFFKDKSPVGDNINFGYIDEKQNETIFYSITDKDRVDNLYDELVFRKVIINKVHSDKIQKIVAKFYNHPALYFEKNFMFIEIQAAFFNIGDSIYILDEINNTLYKFNCNCEYIGQTKICFEDYDDSSNNHFDFKNYNNWKWKGNIIIDDYLNKVYLIYKNKIERTLINRLELNNGKVYKGIELKCSFIKKILIYNNLIYYLYKPVGSNENWALYKQNLD
ncbi:MAG: carboxypeptidase-like regulatory domain-containing protein [Bacteroidales bacterium]|nr:carboxypeptidase-like regulatory domain-containing protein [Bacteroidales bacterium]